MHHPTPALTLYPLHSHYHVQEQSSRRHRHGQSPSRDWHEEREEARRERGTRWQPMSDEQQHNRQRTAKSLDPPLRELLRMSRALREEIRNASADATPPLPHPEIQPDYDPSQDLLVNFSWMTADEVVVEPSTDYFAARPTSASTA